MTEENVGGSNNRWRISKEIPLTVVVVIIIQTAAFVWALATHSNTLGTLVQTVAKAESQAYTKEDAHNERELQTQIHKNMADRTDDLLRRLTILESNLGHKQ